MANNHYILVVDDDWMNREMLEAQLESEGHAVKLASNGKKALEIVDAARPALVMLDIRMPDMDGIDVCQQMRTRPIMQNIPIVMITGLESEEDIKRALAAGANDLLSKPFSSQLMLARVKNWLRITTLQDELAKHRQ